jgi:Flp pilus assembly protein TadD
MRRNANDARPASSPRRTANRTVLNAIAILLAASTVTACADRSIKTGSINPAAGHKPVEQMTAVELEQAIDSYSKAYERNPKDKQVAMAFASVLRMNERNDQALAVMRKAAIDHSKDKDVLAAYGKALASAGQFTQALDAIQRAQDPTQPDWRLLSAEGAIYDQTERPKLARQLYEKALTLKPGEPTILSNLGMSHLLEGNLGQAENYLRQASQSPQADSRVRQNLALVVGLQGRFDEAEQIARRELSPDQAEANVAYLRSMLSQQNAWNMIKQEDKKKARQ